MFISFILLQVNNMKLMNEIPKLNNYSQKFTQAKKISTKKYIDKKNTRKLQH